MCESVKSHAGVSQSAGVDLVMISFDFPAQMGLEKQWDPQCLYANGVPNLCAHFGSMLLCQKTRSGHFGEANPEPF